MTRLSMREHLLSGHGHLGGHDLAVQRVGDMERTALGAAVGDVGHKARLLARVYEMGRQAVRVEAPDAHSEVAHREPVLLVRLDAVRAGVAALSTRRCSSPFARRRYTRPLGSAIPVCPWSVKYRSPLSAKCRSFRPLKPSLNAVAR